MPDTLCRLAIHVVGPGAPTVVDVALPGDCPVGVLIPSVVDVALGGPQQSADPRRWYLTRGGGGRLDNSMTLRESGVHDGDLLLLATAPPPAPQRRPGDACGVVAGAAEQAAGRAQRHPMSVACLVVTAASAGALAWSGSAGGSPAHLWTAATLSAATAAVAVATGRTVRRLSVVSSVAAVVFATVTGALAVPGAPWAPTSLLAACSGLTVSILLLRMACADTAVLTALAALTGTVGSVGAIGVIAAVPVEVAGAILTVLSLAGLSAAPKLTVAVAGLSPSRPDIADRHALAGHRVLTGLVAGGSAAATLGVATVAAVAVTGSTGHSAAVAVAFCADVALLLLLRQRTHIDARRRIALGTAGSTAALAAVAVAVDAAPEHAYWLCAAAVVATMVTRYAAEGTVSPTPVVRQGIQALEYLALAAVVPLAAWVAGVYGLVRDLALP